MSPVSETQDTDWIDVEEDVLDGTADGEMSIWGSDRPYVAKDSTALGGEVEPGIFTPFYSSGPRIPSGTYSCVMRHDRGICLQKIESRNDELTLLPDSVSTELIEKARRFWLAKDEFRKRGFLHKRGFSADGTGRLREDLDHQPGVRIRTPRVAVGNSYARKIGRCHQIIVT
jgi:hypothetical protein